MANKGAVVARIVSEYSDKGTRAATKDFKKLSGDSENIGSKIAGTFKKIAAAAAVIEIARFGMDAIKAAEVVNGAFAKMNNAFANTGSALTSNSPQVEELVGKMGNLAFTAGETADALARGATIFGSASMAMDNMSLAANIARTNGMSLTDSMLLLGKAAEGKTTKALNALGVTMPKVGTNAQKFKSVTDQLTASLKGQADAYAQTHPLEVMKTKMEEMSSSIGQLLMPAFNKVVSFISNEIIPTILKFVNFLRANPQYLQPFLDVFAQIITTLAKVGGVVIDLLAVFAKMDSVILQVVRGMAWITGNKEMANWAKKAADGMGKLSSSLANAGKKMLTYVMHSTKLHSVAPITIKALSNIKTATDSSATATSKLTAEQLKSLAALKALGVVPTSTTDPIELEAARLNLVKQGNIADAEKLGITLALIDAQMQSNQAIQRYSDILQALADDHISSAEIETLAKKWGISQDAVVAYIAQVTGAASWDPKDLGSPGAVAADGWKNALTALNDYYKALKSGAIMAPSAGGSAAITPSPTSPGVAAIVAAATPQSGTGNIGINYNQPGSTSLFASSGSSAWGLGSANPGVNYNQPPTVNITVQGSVVTQNDLVTAVTAGIQQNIISGRSISFSNTGL